MATRKVNSTTRLNRAALAEIRGTLVDGMADIGAATIAAARPHVPDEPPFGKGLVDTGDWGVWADGKKVAGTATKPKREVPKDGITLMVGYDFPGRFQEEGTVHNKAQPFLTPAMLSVLPDKDGILAKRFG
jgi:hypothetical protein